MSRLKITADDGEELFGTLPTGWHDTPLAPYVALDSATTMPETCEAVAQLLGLPAEPFLSDASLVLPVRRLAPFLFDGSLPEASGPVGQFTHEGVIYAHVGHLDKVSAEQMEALLGFLQAHEGKPLAAAPDLLAVLYCPVGRKQTADVVEAAGRAFATLPMSVAWPALADFLRNSGPPAASIRTAWAAEKQLKATLDALEAGLTGTASTTFWQRRRAGLTRWWVKSVHAWLFPC